MNEQSLLDHIATRSSGLVGGTGWKVSVGPGDDCAVLETANGELLLLTVDQLIEGRHFEPDTATDLIARKAVARSVSDIAAMGGTPAWGLATAILPPGETRGDDLFDAMSKWATAWGCPLVGGDIAFHASDDHPLTLSVTVGGAAPTTGAILRSGAKAGDAVSVSGSIGGSFSSGRHLTFEPRLDIGRAAAASGAVRAMIDLSDGLGLDADRVARASGVVLEIDPRLVPIVGSDWRTAFGEGEDYELLLVHDPNIQLEGTTGIGVARLGDNQDPPGAVVREGDNLIRIGDLGWDHGH